MALLANSSFVQGITGWRPVNFPSSVSANVVADVGAAGGHLLRAGSSSAGGSVAYDANVSRGIVVAGWAGSDYVSSSGSEVDRSVGAIAWVRATPGSGQFSATLSLWQLPTPNHNTATNFTVGEQWTTVGLTHDMESGGSTIRVEFYLNSPGHSLDIDSVMLF